MPCGLVYDIRWNMLASICLVRNACYQYKNDLIDGFTKKYGVHFLVYHEVHNKMDTAITREKQIKKWKRQWKIDLIEKDNQEWRDLYDELV